MGVGGLDRRVVWEGGREGEGGTGDLRIGNINLGHWKVSGRWSEKYWQKLGTWRVMSVMLVYV